MENIQNVTVLAIVVITYLVGMGAKASTRLKNESIPIIVGTIGGILGVAGMYLMPEFPANNIMDAIAIGIVSGLASTGANQLFKQVKKHEDFEQE